MFVSFGGYDNEDRPCTDVCKFDEVTGTFQPFLDLKHVYPEVGDKMGYQVTAVGELRLQFYYLNINYLSKA